MSLSFALLIALYGALPAVDTEAPYRYPVRQAAGWYVYAPTNNCFMMKQFPDGTQLKFNWNAVENASYLNLTNQNWDWIRSGKIYRLSFAIDDWQVDVDAVGSERGDGSFSISFFSELPLQFKSAIENGRVVRVSLGDQMAGEYSLEGSMVAMAELDRCAAEVADDSPVTTNGQ